MARGPRSRVMLLEMQVEQGWREPGRLVISASDVLGSNAGLAAAAPDAGGHLLEIGDVCVGDVVIHEDHGIAVIAGLSHKSPAAGRQEAGDAIELEYAGGAQAPDPGRGGGQDLEVRRGPVCGHARQPGWRQLAQAPPDHRSGDE